MIFHNIATLHVDIAALIFTNILEYKNQYAYSYVGSHLISVAI